MTQPPVGTSYKTVGRAVGVALGMTLSGDVLASEESSIVSAISNVRGVEGVKNNLTSHAQARGVPSLQGMSTRPGHWSTWLRSGWSPTAILIVTAGTAALATGAAMAQRRSEI
jgi:hypothetical protein